MAQYKIKLEDKAAFLNRLEKAGVAVDTDQIVDNKLEGYFTITVDDPSQLQAVQTILKQSPKITVIKEKLTKDSLREIILQELKKKLEI